ncbi:MAG TPA: OmpW family outer membrane protein [Burkholderiaceae bacterium]
MKHSKQWPAALALAALAGGVHAQKAGDWVVGAGALHYAPQDKSTPLSIVSPVQREVTGSGASVSSATTLGLNVHYFVTDNWAVEGVLGVPPKIKLNGAGTFSPLGELGSARLYAPAILGKYFFGNADDKLRFSVGAGVTYNAFHSIRLTSGLQNTLGASFNIPPGASSTSADIDSKWAPVFTAGVNYAFDQHWGLSFSVSYVPVKVNATLNTQVAGKTVAVSKTRLTLDPIIPFLYATYKF